MKRITQEELDYLYGKINFGASNLDAKAIDIMNRSAVIFKELEDSHKAMEEFIKGVENGDIQINSTCRKFKELLAK